MKSTLNRKVYASLLGDVLPKVIESEEENELFLAEVEKLMAFGEDLTPEQLWKESRAIAFSLVRVAIASANASKMAE
jgi:hypothetical protein